jgi:cytochrome c oxidase assembly protein subunit 15
MAPWSRPASHAPPFLRRLGVVLAAAGAALILTGAFATAAGPHPGDSADVRRLGSLETTVWIHVRATAVFGIAFLVVFGYLLSRRDRYPRLFQASLGLLGLLVAQMVVGEIQYRTELPWGVVLVHVALAGAVWAATVAFVTLLWRPPDPAPRA